jgi:hypothetical protein
MVRVAAILSVTLALTLPVAGCAGSGGETEVFAPVYDGVETRLLDGDLVSFRVQMRGARDGSDVERYAECAAAQYALIRGYGFARHVRTLVTETAGNWEADAVYTISPALPAGERTIDAEVTVADCGRSGIPTV